MEWFACMQVFLDRRLVSRVVLDPRSVLLFQARQTEVRAAAIRDGNADAM
jgi:hypothetical protein